MFKRKNKSPAPKPDRPKGLFKSLREGLRRTRDGLTGNIAQILLGKGTIDAGTLEEIETTLLTADLGLEATSRITDRLTERLKRHQLGDPAALRGALREEMLSLLQPISQPLAIPLDRTEPFVVLMVGVNGTGKTTTIGKLARRFKDQGLSVALAAGDTFRAAAVEQLKHWGARNDVPVTAQDSGADPASVVYDALSSCKARGIDVLIADTAGRLHTQSNLMEELKKISRVVAKLDPAAPHEIMLVIDATMGQNALAQAVQFHEAVGLTGITLTKLDGTAKGGIIFALAHRLGIPIRFIGIGEQAGDLRVFDAEEFVSALLADDPAAL